MHHNSLVEIFESDHRVKGDFKVVIIFRYKEDTTMQFWSTTSVRKRIGKVARRYYARLGERRVALQMRPLH